MESQKKHYTSEFKNQAVSLVIDAGRPAIEVCQELGIKSSTLPPGLARPRPFHEFTYKYDTFSSFPLLVLVWLNKFFAKYLSKSLSYCISCAIS